MHHQQIIHQQQSSVLTVDQTLKHRTYRSTQDNLTVMISMYNKLKWLKEEEEHLTLEKLKYHLD